MTGLRPRPGAAAVALALVASTVLAGCTRFGPPCTVSIAAIPSGAGAADGATMPMSAVILASPADFLPKKAAFGQDAQGRPTVELQLEPVSAARLASYTSEHIGEPLAIAIERTIFTVTEITGEIPDGAVTVVPKTPEEAARLPKAFEGCVAFPSQPPPASPTASG